MNANIDRTGVSLVLIDCERLRYSRYIGAFMHRAVEGRPLTTDEVEHFRINPCDFIAVHCGPEAA